MGLVKPRYDILCIGSATVDTFLEVDTPLRNIHLGDKILVSSSTKHPGGGAINSAITCTRLGLKAKVLTKLGKDHDSGFIRQELQKHKIENICRNASIRNTDSSAVIDYRADKDRIIYNHKGASSDLDIKDFSQEDLSGARWIYLATQMGNSFAIAEKIAVLARRNRVPLLFNPSLYLAKKGKFYLKEILRSTHVLVLNKEEAQALLKTKRENPELLLYSLRSLGPETVVITDGAKKMYALHQGKIYALTPPKVKIVHTAGAGDAFTAGLLSMMIKRCSFDTALKVGQAEATSVIQDRGVVHKLLDEKEALNLIKHHNLKVEIH
jgi:sugar/nucleoside kinase (ribokinase family)